jgi:hypothetical protein
MKTFYVINRNDMREVAKIAEMDLPDLLLNILDRNCYLSETEFKELTNEVLTAPQPHKLYWLLDYLEFDILDDKKQLIGYIAQNR